MRHLGSVMLSLLLAPLIWVGTGVGASKLAEGLAQTPDRRAALFGLGAIGVAGLLYSLLVLSRLSPLGPVLVGLGFVGATAWAITAASSFRDTVPADFLGVSDAGRLPSTGFAALLAVPLLATIFSPRRWRRHDYEPDPGTHGTLYGAAGDSRRGYSDGYDSYGYDTSGYGSSGYGSSGYGSSSYGSSGASRYGSSYSPVSPAGPTPMTPPPTSPPLSSYRRGDEPDDTRRLSSDR